MFLRQHWALLSSAPSCNIEDQQPVEGSYDVDYPNRSRRGRSRRTKGQVAEPLARSRPHLPDARGASSPCGHPLYLFRSYRLQVLDRLRHDRARHRQLLHGDVLLSVGIVCMAGHYPEGTAELFVRSPASAWPAIRDLRVHDHSYRLLRDLPPATSRGRLRFILVENDHRRALGERTGLVPLGLVRLRPGCLPPVSAVTQPPRSDQSPLPARSRSAHRVLRGHVCCHRCVLHSRAKSTSEQAVGSSSGRSRSSTAA